MSQRVFVTGLGIITSIGKNAYENFESLVHRRSGVERADILKTHHRDDLPVGEIKIPDADLLTLGNVPLGNGFTRTAALGLVAVQEALRSAGLSRKEIAQSIFISATSTGGIREFENFFFQLQADPRPGAWEEYRDTANPGDHAERIADRLGIRSYVGTISTACSSSANAIMTAARMIRHRQTDLAICGGTEALSKFTINGFNALLILDHEACKPFDDRRKGLNLGEGAAYLVLESESSMTGAGRTPLAELLGYGNANDAFHQTASSPEGTGATNAMKAALQSAGIAASDIGYINAHGTATQNNDLSEGLAIQKIFGDQVPPFSSTKPFTGHTLAAAGAVEAVYSILALQHGVLYPNLNFQHAMQELDIRPVTQSGPAPGLRRVLSNSFGFGGNTSSLVIGSAP